MVSLALIYSRQPGNPYTGGSNENAEMFALASDLAGKLRERGIDVRIPPNVDQNSDGKNTFADNVKWVNAEHKIRPFDLVISLHSNALGDATILYGTSNASLDWANKILIALNDAAYLPFGDSFDLNTRKVSEVADTAPPAVLLEVGRHDTWEYAEWLRLNIRSGAYGTTLADVLAPLLGGGGASVPTPPSGPSVPSQGVTPNDGTASSAFPLKAGYYFGPRDPVLNKRSVSGYFSHRDDLRRVQARLSELGYDPGAIDGLFGPNTRRAIRTFQANNPPLAVDGLAGIDTWNRLF